MGCACSSILEHKGENMGRLLIYGMGNEARKFLHRVKDSSRWQIAGISDSTINTRGGYERLEGGLSRR